jgi:class 3 adenylate cyclase/predicted ATPase
VSEISAWLERLGLGQYAHAFVASAVGLDVLPDLSDADFERLGVPLEDRKRILNALSTTVVNSRLAKAGLNAPASRLGAERRQLTVLFCDLVGSTVLAVRLDPEDLSAVIRRFQATSTAVITSYGGYVAKFLGDGLLAYFGYPAAHEDEAENAVHAGLDLVAKVARLLLPSGEALQVRVGVATGLVVVGNNTMNGSTEVAATGETPNLAARLQELASPNTVVVSEVTRRLLGGGFVCERLAPQKAKGFSQPINAFKITGEKAVDSRFAARIGAKLTQFVGRQRELALLVNLWERAKNGEGQVALVCGEPGIGKSRMTLALTGAIASDEHATIRWQCSPHHTNSPFYPVIRNLERAMRFESEDSASVRLEKLETFLSRYGQATLADAPLFAALLSIPSAGRYPPLDLTPQRQKDLTIDALIRQVLALTPQRPALALLEDVHWLDPTTLELLDRTIEAVKSSRSLIVMTFRPEFFAPWLDQAHVTMLQLERLNKGEVATMLANLTDGKGLPVELSDVIVSKTDGVPLFVEEMTKAILETGMLEDVGERYVIQGPIAVPSIPVTLHDSLMARLDRLAPVKEVAQIGAAIGREFPYRLLAAVAPLSTSALDSALSQLAAADLIHARGQPPDCAYVFKHALIQDAAYGSLLRSRRQQLHSDIADALSVQFRQIVETQPELMAHHLEQAKRPKQAIDYLRKAGQVAIERSAHAEAIGHLMHALDLLEPVADAAQRQVALELEVLLGQAMIGGRGYAAPETLQTYLRAKALFDDWTEPAQKFAVLYGLWANYYVGGEVAKQRASAAEFLAEAERHRVPSAVCLSHRTIGTTYVTMGEFESGRRHLEQARALYEQGFESAQMYYYGQDVGSTTLCYLCWALWQIGRVDEAAAVAARAVRLAESLSHPFTLAYVICHAEGMMDVMRRHPEGVDAYAQTVISLCSEHGYPFWGAGGQILHGWATAHDDPEKGVELIRAGLAAWRKTGARLWLPIFVALEGEAHAAAGRSDAALQAVDQAIAISGETGERWAIAEVLRLKAQMLSKSGRGEVGEVEALLHESLDAARSQGSRSWQLRTACDLVQFQHRRRGEQDALKLLRSVYREFSEGFGTPDLIAAKALLEGAPAQGKRGRKAKKAAGSSRTPRTNERSGKPRGRS